MAEPTLSPLSPLPQEPAPSGRPQLSDADARQWAMFVHLSSLSVFVGIPGIVGPLILWLLKKDESPFVDRHGKSAVNFQLSLMIYVFAAVLLFFMLAIVTFGLGVIFLLPVVIVLAFAVIIVAIGLPLLACFKAQAGQEYTYPLSMRLLK